MAERCPVTECDDTKASYQLACKKHWFWLPKAVRDRIWALYRNERGSVAHRRACLEALNYLNDRAGAAHG